MGQGDTHTHTHSANLVLVLERNGFQFMSLSISEVHSMIQFSFPFCQPHKPAAFRAVTFASAPFGEC